MKIWLPPRYLPNFPKPGSSFLSPVTRDISYKNRYEWSSISTSLPILSVVIEIWVFGKQAGATDGKPYPTPLPIKPCFSTFLALTLSTSPYFLQYGYFYLNLDPVYYMGRPICLERRYPVSTCYILY
jgi:hypothetical protein